MEFHIARAVRERLQLDETLFSYTGNVVFANLAACRRFAQQLEQERAVEAETTGVPREPVNAGALYALGLIDELSHALIARYRRERDPELLPEALRYFDQRVRALEAAEADGIAEPGGLDRLLLRFTEAFPNTAVFNGELTAAEWLAGETEGLANREAALEELLLLWLTNRNPATKPFAELFTDEGLGETPAYAAVTGGFGEFFATRPPASPEGGTLLEVLRAPALAAPDSLTAQLEVIRELWEPLLGDEFALELRRVLLAIDTVREEDIAIWTRFNPAAPDQYRHGAPGFGGEGFEGDEYVGFANDFRREVVVPPGHRREGDYLVAPDGTRRRIYDKDYQAPLNEYEAFSADQAWMPTVVLLAKSTYVWLEQLSQKYGRHIHRLDHIPDEELRLIADRGMTGLWLIGLWERSVASQTIKRLRGHADAVASAYSLKRYDIAEDLGGNAAYETLRDRAAAAGIRLASDMVPNHMGIDADWVIENPDWFLSRPESPFPVYRFEGPDLSTDPRVEIKIEDHYYDQTDAAVVFRLRHHLDGDRREGRTRYMYHGNDGTTFAWNDTAQLDYSRAEVREVVMQAILHVARLFPIIRFDAAMVLAKRHVQRLWFPLPGAGGSIPSRAEDAISQEQFDALMPVEFWREVVDRVAVEVPGTLLLAEAFWLLEGYFVRTLGMHRVYNSAFMNMLRDEENAKYRSYLKKTIEFDPDILKRYVNFMSNPDERTALDQFGSGDRFFGVSTLLATLPGLPMFGHGQVEGFTERYGMEFKRAKTQEWPDEGLIARHQHEIAPLLKNRHIFAESTHFVLYDFWAAGGGVDENVFAYSNRHGDGDEAQRALIVYNNAYATTAGELKWSVEQMDKGSGVLGRRELAQALDLDSGGRAGPGVVYRWRDSATGLEYVRRADELVREGMRFHLRGYQYVVLLDWRRLESTATHPWDRLADALGGRGVASLDVALGQMRLEPLADSLRTLLSRDHMETLLRLGREHVPAVELPVELLEEAPEEVEAVAEPEEPVEAHALPAIVTALRAAGVMEAPVAKTPAEAAVAAASGVEEGAAVGAGPSVGDEVEEPVLPEVAAVARACGDFLGRARELEGRTADETERATAVSDCARVVTAALGEAPGWGEWALLLAWCAALSLGEPATGQFDRLQLRAAIAQAGWGVGLEGEEGWRLAAKVRLLLRLAEAEPAWSFAEPALWEDADLRWLAGENEAFGKRYVGQEAVERLARDLRVPLLAVKRSAGELVERASSTGYRLELLVDGSAVEEVDRKFSTFS